MFHHVLPDVPDAELRLLEPQHAHALFTVIDANRACLRVWLPCINELSTYTDVMAFIGNVQAQSAASAGLVAGLWFHDELAGIVGFNAIDPINHVAEIIYWLGEAFEGHGLMTCAVRVFVDYAFDTLHMHRAVILCMVGNTRSVAVARRRGFTFAGEIREAECLGEHFVDDEMYVMLSPMWHQVRTTTQVAPHV